MHVAKSAPQNKQALTEPKSIGWIMNDSHIRINGMPLEDLLAVERSIEISEHFREEVKTLAVQCGVRRRHTSPRMRFCRPGRPRKAVSLLLLAELEPYLKDETLVLRDIADLFEISLNDLKFYQRRLSVRRKRGRKCGNRGRRTA